MSFQLSKKEQVMIAVIFLLLTAGLISFYLLTIKPIQATVQELEMELNQEEAVLATIDASINDKQDKSFQGTMELQKVVPVEPLLEQFLLDLVKAETVSNSFITSMEFGGSNDTDETTNIVEEYMEEVEETDEENSENTNDTDAAISSTRNGTIPEGLKRLTVTLTVESPSYYELEAFIRAIEELKRITKVDELSFSGNKEIVSTEDEPEKLTYTLTLSTFYYPKLAELRDQLPPLEVPKPGQKVNPLVPVVPTADDNEDTNRKEENPTDEAGESDTNYTIIKHKVKQGETLYSISQEYYRDRGGEEIIREWNQLTTDTVYTRQVLEIPFEEK
jgi:type IV pilus assembly protein PilO